MLKLDMPELSTSFRSPADQDQTAISSMAYLENALGVPFTQGNTVEALHNGDRIFPAMLSAIQSSHSHIELLTYIYWTGQVAHDFAESLSERALAGVTVRVLLDAYGSMPISRELVNDMIEAGVLVQWFRPVRRTLAKFDWRTHRKILICDGRVAFTGGVGIASEWEGDARNSNEWRETHFSVRGPAVKGLSGAFWDNWIEDGETPLHLMTSNPIERPRGFPLQVVRSNSGYRTSDAYKVLHALITLAQERVDIVSPYFVPEPKLMRLLCRRAADGIKVRILIPGAYSDKRFERRESANYFSELLEAGVRIYLYQKTMIHMKLVLCDEQLALFGSINFNRRSLLKDEEIGVIAASPVFVRQMRETYEADLQDAKAINPQTWQGPNVMEAFTHRILSPFRDQL